MVELSREYIEVYIRVTLAKKMNVCACDLNKLDKTFDEYSNLNSIMLAEFFKEVYEHFSSQINIDIREITKTTSLANLAYYLKTKTME